MEQNLYLLDWSSEPYSSASGILQPSSLTELITIIKLRIYLLRFKPSQQVFSNPETRGLFPRNLLKKGQIRERVRCTLFKCDVTCSHLKGLPELQSYNNRCFQNWRDHGSFVFRALQGRSLNDFHPTSAAARPWSAFRIFIRRIQSEIIFPYLLWNQPYRECTGIFHHINRKFISLLIQDNKTSLIWSDI